MSVRPLVKCDNLHNEDAKVAIFDILSIICIFAHTTNEEKATFLFRLFNVNQSGLMTEEEHYNFMQRTVDNFRKMRLIGLLDWTQNEVQFLALQARSSYHPELGRGEIKYKAGLSIADFLHWLEQSSECKAINKFFEVFNKLNTVLELLHGKADQLADILTAKLDHFKARSDPVKFSGDETKETYLYSAYCIGRSAHEVGLCVRKLEEAAAHLHIRCDKYVEMENTDNISPKHYLLTSYHQHSCSSQSGYEQVLLRGLSPQTLYRITICGKKHCFRTIEVMTPPKLHFQRQIEGPRSSLCVLPSILSSLDAENFLRTNENLVGCSHIVFTGTICKAFSVLKQMIEYLRGVSDRAYLSSHPFLVNAASSVERLYSTEWESSLRTLYSLTTAFPSTVGVGPSRHPNVYSNAREKQLTYFEGMGWLHDPRIIQELSSLLGIPSYERLNLQIGSVYNKFSRNLVFPRFYSSDGSITTVLLGGGNGLTSSMNDRLNRLRVAEEYLKRLLEREGGASDDPIDDAKETLPADILAVLTHPSPLPLPPPPLHGSPAQFIEYLEERLDEDALVRSAGVGVRSEHMVVVMQTPLDLLSSECDIAAEIDRERRRRTRSTHSAEVEGGGPLPPPPLQAAPTKVVHLTGRYELGESER